MIRHKILESTAMMHVIMDLFQNLAYDRPFALARFNDGEVNGIMQPKNTYTAARGDQFIDEELQSKLYEAIIHEQKNYYKGIPCPVCFPELHEHANSLVGDYRFKTYAVVQTNRNLQKVVTKLREVLKNKRIIWVSGEDQEHWKLNYVGINVDDNIELPVQNAWKMYKQLRNIRFAEGDVVFLSCGPLAEVLVYEWFKNNPLATFIDIGSVFDPLTRNVWHRCHLGTLPKCRQCN